MTNGVTRNWFLLTILFLFSTYWIVSFTVPNPFISVAMSTLLLVGGSITTYRYGPTAFQVVFRERRGTEPGTEGSHLAVVGTTFLALGCVYSGIFGLIWNAAGQPIDWLGSGVSSFGRGIMACGFMFMSYSSTLANPPSKIISTFWLFTGAVVLTVSAFLAGTRFAAWHMGFY